MSVFNGITKLAIGASCLVLSQVAQADLSVLPLPQDFKTRMTVENKYPVVLDGYSRLSDSEITEFYRSKLGDPEKVTQDLDRFTLFYNIAGYPVRISVYPRGEFTEVSAIMRAKGN